MITIKCQLRFQDGTEVSASVTAPSPQGIYPVTYGGALDRLPERPSHVHARNLKSLCEHWAKQLNAEVITEKHGRYDIWAK